MIEIRTLWIGSELSNLERLCLSSFLYYGHKVYLYTYEDVKNVPTDVIIEDANEIVNKEEIFLYRDYPSYSAFSNLFRYILLEAFGEWWVDTDVICLSPFKFDSPYVFGRQSRGYVGSAVMKVPKGCTLVSQLRNISHEKKGDVDWGENGPTLLTRLTNELNLKKYVQPVSTFYPTHWKDWKIPFEAEDFDIPVNSHSIHLWNEMLRRANFNKNDIYPSTSLIEMLRCKFGC